MAARSPKKVYVVTVVLNAGRSHVVGPFATKQAANALMKRVQDQGVFGSRYTSVAFAQVDTLIAPADALALNESY